mmetsp:Transcript_12284/g.16746  ORF Transcript_12284/g.16746 Transcript_12284/m.16746 type:complete len:432 (+) Transcript_12284:254-1549(+)|eukprot:CAMPEP_0196581086 /NCGR_PEP_ID=MMETSP1081-20130531/32326_1 /TAXON_ID=36882 /ORGANISM="Pyramimonas amylifera, Strain CCMP720" /LENGTH=431 /DNA_ID=CAMNT_0041901183 /DNA_START=167 /DNA_END=1462 /DNA_ORIENTATION=-
MQENGVDPDAVVSAGSIPAMKRKRQMFHRSYYSEELVPVIVVVCAVAMSGHLKAGAILAVMGVGYWLYLVGKDRLRQLISMDGGVTPDGVDFKYKDGKMKGLVELIFLWLDLEPYPLPLPSPVKCSVFHRDTSEDKDNEEEDKEVKAGEWFPQATTEERVEREVQKEALEKGMRLLCSLTLGGLKEHGVVTAKEAMDLGVIDACMRACMLFWTYEEVVAPALQLLCHLTHHLANDKDAMCQLAKAIGIKKLLWLLATPGCMRSGLVMRRGLQLLGGLADHCQTQTQMLEATAAQVIVTAMRRHESSPEVAQWGCWSLFNLSFESKYLQVLNKQTEGFVKAISQVIVATMKVHSKHQETQRCGCMAFLALLTLPGAPNEMILDLLKDGSISNTTNEAHKLFEDNAEISSILAKIKFIMDRMGLPSLENGNVE